ncbi:hypothetical protein GA0074692_5155 [Micromonospora pallida]|uniref:FtsX-like permease family protein n=2 Tax=Micromonospora pallida TaxID=145854 RepID=A0A1C6TAL6_9ACTN|nr:hypothetical protein GA0074692_5155 [Micromonospora pallida]
MVTRTGILIALGHRVGRRDGWRGGVHRIGLFLSATALVLVTWLIVGIDALQERGEERVAGRAPVFTTDSTAATARWVERPDTVDTYQYLVLYVAPIQPEAPPPPGLPRWPERGEAFLSPGLLRLDPSGAVANRYGTFGGEIAPSGLRSPNELLVYARPALTDALGNVERRTTLVSGFGADGARSRTVLPGGRPVSDAYLLLVFFGILPLVALILVAGTGAAEGRDRRVATLDVLGAGRRARAMVILGEALLSTLAGVLVGGALALTTTVVDLRLPATGYVIAADDLATRRGWLPALALASLLVVVSLSAIAASLRPVGTPATSQRLRRGRVDVRRPIFVSVFLVGLLLAVYGSTVRGDWGRWAYTLGLLATLAGTPAVATRVATMLGNRIAGLGDSRGWPSALVGGRWLAARPGTLARVTAAVLIGFGLLVQAQILTTQLTGVERAAQAQAGRMDDSAVLVRSTGGIEDGGRLRNAFGPQRVVEGWATHDGRFVAVGDCVALAQLTQDGRCGLTTTSTEGSPLTAAGAVLAHGTAVSPGSLFLSTVRPEGELQGFFVLNPSGRAGVEEIKRVAQATTGMPIVRTPAEGILGGLASRARLSWWIYDFGLLALLLLAAAAGLGAAGSFVNQAHGVGALASYTGRYNFLVRVTWWNLTLPTVVVGILAAVTAAVLGGLLIRLGGSGSFAAGLLLAAVLLVTSAGIGAGLIAAAVAVGSARRWRPTGD